MSVSSGVKVKLKMSPARLVMVNILLVAFGKVMFVSTVSTCMLSVMVVVMLTVCVWLITEGIAVTLITSGGVLSTTVSMVTFLNSVRLLLFALSNVVALKK